MSDIRVGDIVIIRKPMIGGVLVAYPSLVDRVGTIVEESSRYEAGGEKSELAFRVKVITPKLFFGDSDNLWYAEHPWWYDVSALEKVNCE